MKHISIRNVLSCVIPAFFFAVFMVLGRSFYEDNSWDLVFGSTELFRSSVLHGIGYFILFSVSIAAVIGSFLGLIGGYYGGIIDSIIMRICDALFAFPGIILAIDRSDPRQRHDQRGHCSSGI